MVASVSYLGHKIDSQVHPLPNKTDAIVNASWLTTVTELKAFLGLLSYYGKFIPNLAAVLHPLYELLSYKVKWLWTPKREEAFNYAKLLLTSDSVLIHFNPEKSLVLARDALTYGIGPVLSHGLSNGCEHPIGFAWCTLSTSQQKYSQTEKESLACVFGVKKYNSYLFGHKFTLIEHQVILICFESYSTMGNNSEYNI